MDNANRYEYTDKPNAGVLPVCKICFIPDFLHRLESEKSKYKIESIFNVKNV